MKKSYVEGLANYSGPESCVAVREGRGEALIGVRAGRVLSREITLPGADPVKGWGRQNRPYRYREIRWDLARSQTSCMYGNTSSENREIPQPLAGDGLAGRIGKSKDVRR